MPERIYIDNGLLRLLLSDTQGAIWDSFLDISAQCGLKLENRRVTVIHDWLLFLEFIGLGHVMKGASLKVKSSTEGQLASYFDSSDPWNLDQVNQLIDTSCTDCLIECQKINELEPATLIAKYETQCKYCIGKASNLLVPAIAGRHIEALRDNPSSAHIDICLNLAWQLLSWRLASVMAQTSIKQHPSRVFELFQPLIAVWYQIALDHSNQPNFFRLIEAAYLATISQEESTMSSSQRDELRIYKQKYQSRSKGDLADCSYIDAASIGRLDTSSGEMIQHPITVFTCDKPEQVLSRLSLARYMLERLQAEVENWNLILLYPCKVICLDLKLQLVDTVSHSVLNSFHERRPDKPIFSAINGSTRLGGLKSTQSKVLNAPPPLSSGWLRCGRKKMA